MKILNPFTPPALPSLLSVSARLAHLQATCQQDGWLDGEGKALDGKALQWFAQAWLEHWPPGTPLPHIYPTLEGGLSLEWEFERAGLDCLVSLQSRTAEVDVVLGEQFQHLQGTRYDLSLREGWQALACAALLVSAETPARSPLNLPGLDAKRNQQGARL